MRFYDLAIAKLPSADLPLDRIDHPILRKANASFPTADARGERGPAADNGGPKRKRQAPTAPRPAPMWRGSSQPSRTTVGSRLRGRPRSPAYQDVVPRLVRLAARSGEEERDEAAGYTIGVVIESRDLDEVMWACASSVPSLSPITL